MKKLFILSLMTITLLVGCGREEAQPLAATEDDAVCGQGEGCTLSKEAYVGFEVGDQIPNLELVDVDGNVTNLYDMVLGHDKFVLGLAADWCSDCHRQNEKLDEYYSSLEAQGYGAAVVFVNYSSADGSKTTNEQQMIDFINESDFSFPTFYDKDGAIIDQTGELNAVPYNFVLDENAIIKAKTSEIDMDNLFLDNSEDSRM